MNIIKCSHKPIYPTICEKYLNLRFWYKSKMHLQVKKLIIHIFFYCQVNLSPRSLSSPSRQRQISHSPQLRRSAMKACFRIYCFKSTLTPATLCFFSTFSIHLIFLSGFQYQLSLKLWMDLKLSVITPWTENYY